MKQNRQNMDKTDIVGDAVRAFCVGEARKERGSGDVREVVRKIVEEILQRIRAGSVELKIPGEVTGFLPAGQHRHVMPEVFVQLSGYTDFTCGKAGFRLKPGEVCVMPRGVPHGERVGRLKGKAFCNLVIMYGMPRLLFHLAVEDNPGCPGGLLRGSLECVPMARHVGYLDDLVRVSREGFPVRESAVMGLQQAYFADVWEALQGRGSVGEESVKVARARQLVASRLASPELCVEWLAGLLRCHADYLSHVFRKETGMTLTRYINEQRVLQARDMLERSSLSVKEIAVSLGYGDPGYFTRVFRRMMMVSPVAYRAGRAGALRSGSREVYS